MHLTRHLLAGAAAAVLAVSGGAAQAASLLTATFQGVITGGSSDATFGPGSLIGKTYKAVFTFDPARGATSVYIPLPGYFDYLRAGYGAASPIRSLSLTIAGITDVMDFAGDLSTYGETDRTGNPAAPRGTLYMSGLGARYRPSPIGGLAYDYHAGSATFAAPTYIPFDMSLPWTPAPGTGSASFLRQVQNAGRGYDQVYDLGASVTSVRIAEVTTGVPEPGVWALTITGFALAGAALRRRRAPVA